MDKKIQRTSVSGTVANRLIKLSPELFLQFVLITFSVLVAFGVENWNDKRKNSQDKRDILKRIRIEILNNRILLLEQRSIQDAMKRELDGHFDRKGITKEQVSGTIVALQKIHSDRKSSLLMQNTTWETAQYSNIIQHFSHDVTHRLTRCYQYQDEVYKNTMRTMNDLLNSREAFRQQESGITMEMLRAKLNELQLHSETLLLAYGEALVTLDQYVPNQKP